MYLFLKGGAYGRVAESKGGRWIHGRTVGNTRCTLGPLR